MNDIKAIIAKNIAELRQKSGMTQMEFAEKLNYSDKAVSKWERGESLPDITVLTTIAELFHVTLDYLIHAEHAPQKSAEELAEESEYAKKLRARNRRVILGLGILLVWFVAMLGFVLMELAFEAPRLHWLFFIYAVPVSAIVWLVFNSVWFKPRLNYVIVSLLMWSTLAAIYISFMNLHGKLWQIFLLGAVGQIVILLSSRLKRADKKPPFAKKDAPQQ